MRKLLLASAILLAPMAAPLAAMAQTSTMSDTSSSMSSSKALSAQDQKFIKLAATAGMYEVQAGQLATQKGDSSVQAVGTRMVTDHTKANDQLMGLTQDLGATAPTSLTARQQAMVTKLQGESGSSFDQTYLAQQKTAHLRAIKVFQTEIADGSNPELKSFASTTLPILKMHLQMIEQAMS
jgi:putative membrane protein